MKTEDDSLALYEIRQLSDAAQGLILHKLRNSLQIVQGNISLLQTAVADSWRSPLADRAQKGCERLAGELDELFGGSR